MLENAFFFQSKINFTKLKILRVKVKINIKFFSRKVNVGLLLPDFAWKYIRALPTSDMLFDDGFH